MERLLAALLGPELYTPDVKGCIKSRKIIEQSLKLKELMSLRQLGEKR